MRDERLNDRIRQTKETVFTREGWRCQYRDKQGRQCGESCTELAHEIGQGHAGWVVEKWNQMFNEKRHLTWIHEHVIHNPANMRASCSNKSHNSYFNIGFKPERVIEKLREIRAELKRTGVIK